MRLDVLHNLLVLRPLQYLARAQLQLYNIHVSAALSRQDEVQYFLGGR